MQEPKYLKPVTLADGDYVGIWSGHSLKIETTTGDVWARTRKGVRGINLPVTLTVRGGEIDEDSITPRQVDCESEAKDEN